MKMADNFDLRKSKSFFQMKDAFAEKDFQRKKELALLRFDLSVKLVTMVDEIAQKRHQERCEILGIKYIEPEREKLISNRVELIRK